MTRAELEEAAEERLLSAALAEVRDPQRAELSLSSPSPAAVRSAPHWLLAALVVLGAGVAFAVGVLRRESAPVPVAPPNEAVQEPDPLPPPVRVDGREALEALRQSAPKTRNLWAVVDPEDVNCVGEFLELEQLVLEPRVATDGTVSTRSWSLLVLTRCHKLRSLTLGNMRGLEPKEFEPLMALPALREFGLTGVQHLFDEKLADVLHKLGPRSLKLTAVRVTAPGLRTMCQLPHLENLVLWHCLHLERCDLSALAKLRTLRSLELHGVGWSLASALAAENPLPGEPAKPSSATPGLAPTEPPQALLSAALMQALAQLPHLRELELSSSVLTADLLAALPKRLHRLGLRENVVDRPDAFAQVVLPELRSLSCSVPHVFGPGEKPDDFGERQAALCALLDRQQLRELRFLGTITAAMSASLKLQMTLEELHFHHAGHKDAVPIELFATMPKLQRIRLTNVSASVDPAPLQKLPALVRIELQHADADAVQAFRKALGDRVVEINP